MAEAHRRLRRPGRGELSEAELALAAVLDFTLAIGRADGTRAASLVDAVGYQPLPGTGGLPEAPGRPMPPEQIRSRIAARKPRPLDALPATDFRVLSHEAVRGPFPAVADWMLPGDWAIVIEPAADTPWISARACVVVRLRARKPSVLGGNLLDVLSAD